MMEYVMKKVLIAALIGLTALPSAAQASGGSRCTMSFPGSNLLRTIIVIGC
jgi:hypothetical protein